MSVAMLCDRMKTRFGKDELVQHLQQLGCDVEGYATVKRFGCKRCDNIMEIAPTENPPVLCDRCGADFKAAPASLVAMGETDVLRMELLAVRPDIFDPGGLARALRFYFNEASEPSRYPLAAPRYRVTVDPRLREPKSLRPCIQCAVVRGLHLDADIIKVLMKLQENLHWALGRDRKHASIGVYDLDTLHGEKLSYRTVGPEELRFVPLGYNPDDKAASITPKQILASHPKGVAYAWLLEGFERYPLLCDEQGAVMSLPPIINSEATRVRQSTKNVFVDVTGSEERIVSRALNVLVTSLLELDPKAQAEQVTVVYSDREIRTPDLTPQVVHLDAELAPKTIGVTLSKSEVMTLLRRMGHGVSADGNALTVQVPAYRNDIMHAIDLVEDVAIAYGYDRIVPSLVPTLTVGEELGRERIKNVCRAAMTGLGFFEVMTLILSSEEQQYSALRLPVGSEHVLIENPISPEQTMIRVSLLPGLLDTLAVNTDHPLPQRIFEVGEVTHLDAAAETGAAESTRLAAVAIGPRVDFAAVRSTCEALLLEFGCKLITEPDPSPMFIPGRGAKVIAVRGDTRHPVGHIGELHPEVLEKSKLVQPVSYFELTLQPLLPPGVIL
jgi:phenylalanyl-tRNA synthetase beta chain